MPEFNKFGTSVSQNVSIINGKANTSITYKYVLGPKRTGKFIIPPAKITFHDKTYLTETLEVEVIPANHPDSQLNVQTNAIRGHSSQNPPGKMFVKASIDKRTAYENEKLVYKFSLYANMDLIENPQYYSPDFSGFWNDGSKSNNRFELIDGINYHVNEVRTILYPINSGVKTIQPAKLKITLPDFSTPEEMKNFFRLFENMGRVQTKILETNKLEIEVLPLPQEGKPHDFAGAIGDFKMTASLDKHTTKTNSPVTLTVTISGYGNMKSINTINFDRCDDFKKYDTVAADISETTKEFKTIFIPIVPGEKEIPIATLSFFNPTKKQYATIKTQPQKISVSGKATYTKDDVKNRSKINAIRKDIRYNKQIDHLKSYNGYLVKTLKFYLILTPFILMFIISLCYKTYLKKPKLFKRLKISRFTKAQKLITKAELELSNNNFEVFSNLIYQALIEIINSKIVCPADNFDKSQIFDRSQIVDNLRKKNIDDDKIADIIRILDRLDFYKFARATLDKDSAIDLINTIKKIEKTLA
jgi:hypothetical protein